MRISDWSSDVGSSDLRASSSASTTQNACRSGLRPRRPAPDLPRRHCESSAGSRAVGDVAPTYGVEPECGPRPEHYAPDSPLPSHPAPPRSVLPPRLPAPDLPRRHFVSSAHQYPSVAYPRPTAVASPSSRSSYLTSSLLSL